MKAYGGEETLVQDRGQWLASYSGNVSPTTHWIEGWVDELAPRAGLDTFAHNGTWNTMLWVSSL